MKKFFALIAALAVLLCLTGCKAKEETPAAGIANPWQETTAQQAAQAVGDCFVPKNGEQAVYLLNTDIGMAETRFTDANGIAWCCRVQATQEAADISGMYYDFTGDNCGYEPTVTVGEITLTQLAAATEEGVAYVAYYFDGSYTHCFSTVTDVTPIALPL